MAVHHDTDENSVIEDSQILSDSPTEFLIDPDIIDVNNIPLNASESIAAIDSRIDTIGVSESIVDNSNPYILLLNLSYLHIPRLLR